MTAHNKAKTTALLLIFIINLAGNAQTQTSHNASADEQAIRKKVAQFDGGAKIPYAEQNIFVSGLYSRPVIGEKFSDEDKASQTKAADQRLNYKAKTRIERLLVAQAGDMAYEFGYGDLSWDTPENKHVAFEASYVRVWRKVAGEWKVDLSFARPNKAPDGAGK